MIILKIIGWILIVLLSVLAFLFIIMLIQDYGPKSKKSNMYSKMWFSFEMCVISGKKNRGEISEEQEYLELEKEYLSNKKLIDLYALMNENALNYSYTKWNTNYSTFQTYDEHQTPVPIISYWSEEFVQFSMKKIEEGFKPGILAKFYDKYLRSFF